MRDKREGRRWHGTRHKGGGHGRAHALDTPLYALSSTTGRGRKASHKVFPMSNALLRAHRGATDEVGGQVARRVFKRRRLPDVRFYQSSSS